MALLWDGDPTQNERQAKMLSARFRCVFGDNAWFGSRERAPCQKSCRMCRNALKRIRARFWCVFVAVFLPLLPDRAHPSEILFFCSIPCRPRFRKYEKYPFQVS